MLSINKLDHKITTMRHQYYAHSKIIFSIFNINYIEFDTRHYLRCVIYKLSLRAYTSFTHPTYCTHIKRTNNTHTNTHTNTKFNNWNICCLFIYLLIFFIVTTERKQHDMYARRNHEVRQHRHRALTCS